MPLLTIIYIIQFSIITVIKYYHYHTVHVVFMQKEPYNNTYCHTVNVVIHHTRRTTLHTAILLIRNSLHTQDTDNHIVKYYHTVHVVFK